jgi:hypothetical protein
LRFPMNTSFSNLRKLAFAVVGCACFGLHGYGQPALEWAINVGGSGTDQTGDMFVDPAGNLYATGAFAATADFDPGLGTFNLTTAGASSNAFISKLDPAGNFVWAKAFSGLNTVLGQSLTVDALGNIYVVGNFNGTADFDPGAGTFNLTSAGAYDNYVCKLNPSGNFLWAFRLGAANTDDGARVEVDNSGNVFVSGQFRLTVDFDPGVGTFNLTSINTADAFIARYDPNGTFVWAKQFGGVANQAIYDFSVSPTGFLYLVGEFQNTTDFDPGVGVYDLVSAGGSDIFAVKISTSGNFVWALIVGDVGSEAAFGIDLKADAIYFTGYYQGTTDFDTGGGTAYLTSAGFNETYLSKMDTNGTFIWARSFGGAEYDHGNSVAIGGSGNVFLAGNFELTADFDPGIGTFNMTANGSRDIYFTKLDASGNFVSAYQVGGSGADGVATVLVDPSDNIYLTGFFNGTVDFDVSPGTFNLTSAGGIDFYIQKLSQCTNSSSTISPTACNTYTAPGGQVFTTSGTYTATIPNFVGCDSIITINLTINTPPAQPNPISGNSFPCAGTTNTYAVTAVPGATSYIWTLPVGWTGSSTSNSLSATAGSAGGTITVTAINGCGNSTARSLTVGVNTSPPSPSMLMAPSQICINSNVQFAVLPVPGATSYTWSLPVGWTGSSTTDVINVFTGSSGGLLTVTANNVCGASTPPFTSNITLLTTTSQPGPINGPTAVCAGATVTYSVNPVPGASGYQWSIPSGWTGSSTTNTITVVAGSVGGTISVNTTNFCGNSLAQSLNVTITALPSQPSNIAGNDTVCANSTNTYSVPAVSGATAYTWTLPNGWTGSSTSNSLSASAGSVGGTITVTANNSCGSSAAQSIAVTVNTVPAQPGGIAGLATICEGFTDLYSISPIPGATSYTWTLPGGWIGSSGSSSISATASANGGTISVTANNACGSSVAQTQVIMVQPLPSLTGQITGDITVCEGETYTYAVSPDPNASSYTWTLPSGWAGSSVSNSVSATAGLNGGTVSVTSTNSCGTSNPVTLSVTVAPDPTAAFTSTSNLLVVTFTNTSSTSTSWNWDFGDGNTSTLQHPVHTYASAGTYNVCLTATENSCSATTCNVVTVVAVGMEDDLGSDEVLVWPNPSSGVFHVACQGQLKGEVMDVHGRVVLQQTFEAGTTELDLTGYANGVYFLRLADAERRVSMRLVKVAD